MEKAIVTYKSISVVISHVQMREILTAYKTKLARHQDELDRLDQALIDGLTTIVREMDFDKNSDSREGGLT